MNHAKIISLIITFTTFSISLSLPNLIVFGVHGSGKGTLSEYLIDHYGYHHLSSGDLVRNHVKNNSEIQQLLKQGQYIEDEFAVQLVAAEIRKFHALQVPFIIDGHPRNEYCLNRLLTLLQELQLTDTIQCIYIDASDDTCKHRIANRLICSQCPKVSNTKHTHCTCGAELIQRSFDDAETTKTRINLYRTNIEPLMAKLKELFPVYFFNTESSIETCYSMYEKLMNELSVQK